MPDTTNRLSLPTILPAQAQKHVTHNEALQILDAIVQLVVVSDDQVAPPFGALDDEVYIVAPGATGDWAGQSGALAILQGGAWMFLVPRPGWRAMVLSRNTMVSFDGMAWSAMAASELGNVQSFGLGQAVDPAARFAATLNAATWSAVTVGDGGSGDMNMILNREGSGDDLGFTFQTSFTSQAVLGQFGSDEIRLSVSDDGITFRDGWSVDLASGRVAQPNLPRFKAYLNYNQLVIANTWVKLDVNTTDYNDQSAFDAATNLFTAPATGTYLIGGSSLYIKDGTAPRHSIRLVKNGNTAVNGTFSENSGSHIDGRTGIAMSTLELLNAGDTVELQGYSRLQSSFFGADHTTLWATMVG